MVINVNENGKKAIPVGLERQKNKFACASCVFVHFFAVTAQLQQENAQFHILLRT